MKLYNIEDLNEILKGELLGSTSHNISGPEPLETPQSEHITFIGQGKYVNCW